MGFLLDGFKELGNHTDQILMIAIGGFLILLAISKKMEPALLLPMGFGAILVNLPLSGVLNYVMPGEIQSQELLNGCLMSESTLLKRSRCYSL